MIKNCSIVIQSRSEDNISWAYNNRGRGYWSLGDLNAAIFEYSIAIKLDPGNAGAFANRAATYVDLQSIDRAIADYDNAILLDQTNAAFRNDRGVALAVAGRYEQAISAFSEAIDLDAYFVEALDNRGNAYLSMGELRRGLVDFRAGLEIAPQDAYLLNSLAWALYLDESFEEALPSAQRAAELLPEPFILDTLGHILAGLGRAEEAFTAFEQAMALGGTVQIVDYQAALVALGYLPENAVDGNYSEETRQALISCLSEQCRLGP